jgi:SAM-dependent methyltransferase
MIAEASEPRERPSESAILQIGSGFRAAKLLFVASELGLFERLVDGPASLGQLASHTGIVEARLRVVVNAMVALGLLHEDAGRYRNSMVAAAYLSGQTSTDLRPALRFWNQLSFPLWANLEHALQTGDGQWGTSPSREHQRIFSEGVEALTSSAARALATRYDFGQHRRILDLGGGTGSWLIPLLRQHGHLRATLVERSGVADIARQRLAANVDPQRVEVVASDFLREPLPAEHDVVLLAHVLHGFTPAQNLELLRRLRAVAAPGARLLLVDNWTDATHTRPVLSPLFAAEFVVFLGQGDVYSEAEVDAWLGETGWRPIARIGLSEPQSVIVAKTAAPAGR